MHIYSLNSDFCCSLQIPVKVGSAVGTGALSDQVCFGDIDASWCSWCRSCPRATHQDCNTLSKLFWWMKNKYRLFPGRILQISGNQNMLLSIILMLSIKSHNAFYFKIVWKSDAVWQCQLVWNNSNEGFWPSLLQRKKFFPFTGFLWRCI